MQSRALFSGVIAALIIASGGAIAAEGMPDLGSWSAFSRGDVAGLAAGGVQLKSNASMGLARGLSAQAIYVVKGKPETVAGTLRTFDSSRYPVLEVFQQHFFSADAEARFSEVKIVAGAAPFQKLLAEMGAPKALQLSKEERTRLPRRPSAAEAQQYWSTLLAERWGRFAREGAFSPAGAFDAGSEIASLLREEPKLAAHFDALLHPWSQAGGARGSTAAQHYWDVSNTDGLANFELGATYERASDGQLQYADVTYYSSSGYLVAVSLFEFIPIAGPGAPQTLVWHGTLVSAADAAGALGLKRKFAVHTVEEEMRKWIEIFRRACADGSK
jgi:hypothetical protein